MSTNTANWPCVFCGAPNRTKAARRKHNSKCAKNVNREKVQEASRISHAKYNSKPDRSFRKSRAQDFSEMFDDLPDGAFFAMAEEHGIEIEDFID